MISEIVVSAHCFRKPALRRGKMYHIADGHHKVGDEINNRKL